MLLDRFRVQPAEVRKFTIDYTPRLQEANLLATVDSVAVDVVTAPPFVVAGDLTIDNTSVVLWTSGGLDGTEYQVDITVTATDGQTWQDEITFSCEEI